MSEHPYREGDNPARFASLAERNAMVFHRPTGFVGRAERYYDGETAVFCPPNGLPVEGPVLGMQGGHTFVAKDPTAFVELADREARMFVILQEGIAGVVRVAASQAQAMGVTQDDAIMLMVAVLRAQANALGGP